MPPQPLFPETLAKSFHERRVHIGDINLKVVKVTRQKVLLQTIGRSVARSDAKAVRYH